MHILHTEASLGWGGQEMRIFRESLGMRERGHRVSFVTAPGAQLAKRARDAGFSVRELPMKKSYWLTSLPTLARHLKSEQVDLVNTHSSADAWLCGIAARWSSVPLVRTRHLSTPSRPGLNSRVLYRWLADRVVATCQQTAELISAHSGRLCVSIPTGIDLPTLAVSEKEVQAFRAQWNLGDDLTVAGSVCVLRRWKGLNELLNAAKLTMDIPNLRWLVVGSGPQEAKLRQFSKELGVEDRVIFTGHLENPLVAIAAMDIFLLLSTANEGVSQASIQAAALTRPLITTEVGGLPEVCVDGHTGLTVPAFSPESVAQAVRQLAMMPQLRSTMGAAGLELVRQRFTLKHTLDGMEELFLSVSGKFSTTIKR